MQKITVVNPYAVYYRTGGTDNFKWHRAANTYTRSEAMQQVRRLEKQGYLANYELASLIDSIGLPETFE